ncbi:MAG: zinc-ribbon domain-containing protein, partial [Anaerolineae bacterium]
MSQCPKCGTAGAGNFCVQCGTHLPIRCTKCGAEIVIGHGFCGKCGAAVQS